MLQCNLGFCYVRATGLQDAAQAVSWYRRAAEAGHTDAQFCLGVCYAKGAGVAKDAEQSVSWYRRGARPAMLRRSSAWMGARNAAI